MYRKWTAMALGLAVVGSVVAASSIDAAPKAGVTVKPFGSTADGDAVELYVLRNRRGVVAKVMTYGALLTELHVPDRRGRMGNVVLGFDNLEAYLKGHPYFGCTVGRVANRIANGKFRLGGKEYQLATNNGPNHLHGGEKGWDKAVWKARVLTGGEPAVRFTHVSPDGDEGYPGKVTATVTYTLTTANELKLDYTARTDSATPINLTHHSYFNLAGEGNGNILNHVLMINAKRYTPTDSTFIPTGKLAPVRGTPFDFTSPRRIGERFNRLKPNAATGDPGGYDLNYVLDGGGKKMALAARVSEPRTGRVMEIWTDEPGIQFYTGNYLDGTLRGPSGRPYRKNDGFCLETQHFPDSINHPNFPSTVLRPGSLYTQSTIHRFYAR